MFGVALGGKFSFFPPEMDEEFAFLDTDATPSTGLTTVSTRRGAAPPAAAAGGGVGGEGPNFDLWVFVDIGGTEVALDPANRFFTNYVITVRMRARTHTHTLGGAVFSLSFLLTMVSLPL